MIDSLEMKQMQTVSDLTARQVSFTVHKRRETLPDQNTYVILDTKSPMRTTVVRIAVHLFAAARWYAVLMMGEDMQVRRAVVVVFVCAALPRDPVALASITLVAGEAVTCVTVASKEDFSKPEEGWLQRIEDDSAWTPAEMAVIQRILPGIAGTQILHSLLPIYNIIAFQLNPQDSEMVMGMDLSESWAV